LQLYLLSTDFTVTRSPTSPQPFHQNDEAPERFTFQSELRTTQVDLVAIVVVAAAAAAVVVAAVAAATTSSLSSYAQACK
jgi:hypothetical protein